MRYHQELILNVRAAAGIFASNLHFGMLADDSAQNPEKLYAHGLSSGRRPGETFSSR